MQHSISTEELRARLNDHGIQTLENALRFKTGQFDVELLQEAFSISKETVFTSAIVGVRACNLAMNQIAKKTEPVFEAYMPNGNFIGHFYASAFKHLFL